VFTRVTGLFILHFSRILGAISVDEDLVLEKVDNSYTITATVFPSNATNKNLTWTTSDESVATVDNGVITAVGPGTATITVTSVADSSKKATVHVVVGDILVPAIFADDPTLGTLQGEIDKAEPGSTIVVAPATYNEQLIINKPLTLLGPNADIAGAAEKRYPEAIIKGTGNGLSQLLEIDAENVEINGFTFDDTRIDNYNNTTGTNTNLIGGIAIVNNRFINTSGTAIYLRDGRNAPGEYSKDIQICNNKIETIISAGTVDYNAGSGIIVMGAEDLRICGNIISNAAYNGIQLARNKNATVTDNIVTDSEQPALQIAQWNEGVHEISGNTFSTKSEEKGAIRLYGFTNNYIPEFNISNNKIENSHYGIQIGHGDAGKSYNDIRDANYSLIGNIFDDISEHELIIYLNTEPSNEEAEEMNTLFEDVYGEGYCARLISENDPFVYIGGLITWNDYADTSWYNDPSATSFTIDTAAKLAGLAELVNGGKDFNGKTINLGADIDLEGIAWIPIGTGSNVFKGNFDGDGKKISNLNINRITSYNGLFGNSSNGKLENVTLENINILIYTPDVTNYAYTGSLAGKAQHVNNVTVTGSINIEVTGGARYVGGIVGHLYNGHMSNCELNSNDGVGLISAKYDVGALAGYVYYGTSITNSTVRNMRINGYLGVGGVSGRIQNEYGAFLLENINIENIILGKLNQGVESSCVGGFLGYPYQSITVTIKDSQLKDVRIESSHIYNGLFYGLYSNTEQYGKVILENVNYSGDCTTQSGEYDYLRKAVGLQKGETVKYYSPIKTAIAAYENAENGDYTIIIKDGTYKEDSIMIRQQVDKSLTIKAENNLKAIFVNENTADSTGIFHISGGSNYDTGAVTFEGIRFELPAGANIDCFGIKLLGESDGGTIHRYASNVTVRNCEFIGNVEKSCAVWSGAGSQPKNILIEGCKGDGLTALYNGYGNGITIKNSQLTNARGLLNSQSTESANELVIEGVEATIDYQPSKDMDAIKINGGHLTVKDSNITLYYNGANRSSGLIVIRGGATIVINNSTLTANKVGGDYDVYTFYGMNPANRSNTVFGGDIEDFTYGGTFEQVEL
jgi:hypothetical protein